MWRSCAAVVFPAIFWTTGSAYGQNWEYRYLPAENTEELSICSAGVFYSDGPFAVRVYSDKMDFYLEDDQFSLPSSERLGNVGFMFKNRDFILEAHSGSSEANLNVNHMYLSPNSDEYQELLNSLRFGDSFRIVFPDGQDFDIGLKGSNEAILDAFKCWSSYNTGDGGVNPFSSSGGINPFQ